MIDLTKLTQEQVWGVEFACMEANKPIQTENEQTTNANANLPEGEDPKPLKPLFTPKSYLEHVIGVACDSYYAQLIAYKKKNALAMFDALSPEEQAALIEQLGIPDVLE